MKRREFLKTSALIVVGTSAAASGIVGGAGANRPRDGRVQHADAASGHDAAPVARRIFPHQADRRRCPTGRWSANWTRRRRTIPRWRSCSQPASMQLNGSHGEFADAERKARRPRCSRRLRPRRSFKKFAASSYRRSTAIPRSGRRSGTRVPPTIRRIHSQGLQRSRMAARSARVSQPQAGLKRG